MIKMNNKKEYMSSAFKNVAGLFQKNLLLRSLKKYYYYVDSFLISLSGHKKTVSHSKKKVIILYNIALGDGVIFRCSALHFRNIYPKDEYELTLVCQKGLRKIYDNDDVFDNIISIDFNKSTISIKERLKSFKELRKNNYDIAIDPVGIIEWTTNIFFTRAIRAKYKIGVIDDNNKVYCSRRLLNRIYDEIIHIDKKNVSLLEYYSIILNKLSTNNYKFDVGFEKIKTSPNKYDLPKKYFVIFPCASMSLKRWSLQNYSVLAKKIQEKTKMPLVLLGTKADLSVLDEFKKYVSIEYIDLIDKTSLNDYIDILSNSQLIITNDTSSYHIALTQQTPVAIITGGYTYDKYVLYDFPRKNEFIKPCIIVNKMPCFNCNNRCPYLTKDNYNWPCLQSISEEFAWKKIEKYIDDLKIGG